ncbi:OmpL47-type beta-barrel domain-containing protein [Paenibacillus sp. FSL H7-0357]|uniref:OmpL47-type beta-barrel domain-containing protein n=1 Tax=Paenibacillus sp. FSL H7-0357 TaxID=1536774 RepID=UPI003FA5CDD5
MTTLGESKNNISVHNSISDYDGILAFFKNEGFHVVDFPYDWRLGSSINAQKLKEKINIERAASPYSNYYIVAHSMGGLVATEFIRQGNSQLIKKMITIGTPFLGAPQAVNMLETGNLTESFLAYVAVGDAIRSLEKNVPSIYELLPNKSYFSFQTNGYIETQSYTDPYGPKVKVTKYNTFSDTENLIKNNRDWSNDFLFDEAKDFHSALDVLNTLKKVDSYYIVGDQKATPGKLVYFSPSKNNKALGDVKSIQGDAVVPVSSATVNFLLDESRTYYIARSHVGLVKSVEVQKKILNILKDKPNEFVSEKIRDETKEIKTVKFKAECPVELHLYDSSGNHTGPTSSETFESNIPDANYFTDGETKIALVNDDENYKIRIVGTGYGELTFSIVWANENDVEDKTLRFDNVTVTPGSIFKADVNQNGQVVLQVDQNGDGNFEGSVSPSVQLDLGGTQDETIPTLSSHVAGVKGVNEWYGKNVYYNLAGDDNASGVYKYFYDLNSSEYKEYVEPITLPDTGIYNFKSYVRDKNRNDSEVLTETVKVDTTNPTVPIMTVDPTAWTNKFVTITLAGGTDADSGFQKYQYKINQEGEWKDYTAPFVIDTEGLYNVYARSVDNVFNLSEEVTGVAKVDKTNPHKPIMTIEPSIWTSQLVTVTLSGGTDMDKGFPNSGFQKYQYKIDDGEWKDYTTPIIIDTEGLYKVVARSVDNANNLSDEVSGEAKIDRTNPIVPKMTIEPSKWTNQSVTITLSDGTDADKGFPNSGFLKYQYKIDDGEWKDYTAPFVIDTEGIYNVYARSVDNVFNLSEEVSGVAKIDKTNPTNPAIVLSDDAWSNENISFTILDGEDNLSHVKNSEYKIGLDGEWIVYNSPVIISSEGITTVYARTIDNAGNISNKSAKSIYIDKTVPTKPSNLTIPSDLTGKGLTSIRLKWNHSIDTLSGINRYDIYANTNLVGNTKDNTYLVQNLTPGTSYKFEIKAFDNAGNYNSQYITVSTRDTMIAASNAFSVWLRADGTVWAWGQNTQGQLGNGSLLNSSTAVQVTGLEDVVAVSAAGETTLALKADGTVWSWGSNSRGQLGNGSTTSSAIPVQVKELSGVIAISNSESEYSLALKGDGTVWGWGSNSSYQLGDGTNTQRLTPVKAVGLSGITAIEANGTSMALKNDGTVWKVVNSAFAKVDNLSGVKQIAAGRFHQLALKKDGTLWAWGANSVGELGNGTATGGTTGVSQVPGMNGVIGIAGGAYYSLAVKSDGSVWAWGYNNLGQLGDGTQTNRWAPIRVTGLSGIKEVSAGVTHSLAKGDDGSVWAWGSNTYGQLGDGSLTARLTPVLVQTNGAPQVVLTTPSGSQEVPTVVGITTPSIGWTQNDSEGTTFTGFQVQILDEAGEVVLDSGTVAQNTTSNTASWTVTEALPVGQKLQVRVKVSDEGAGSEWSAAGWMQVSGEGQAGSSIVAGGTHSVQLKSDGTVWAWGQNTQGQLGNGSLLNSSTAVQVTGLEDVVAVSAAGETTLALKADGTVWSWGSNSRGQLGNGSTTSSAIPVQVKELSGVIAISNSESEYSLALKGDGTVWGWGSNSSYQLGDGTNTQRLTPVKAVGLSGITAIEANGTSMALKNDGTVWKVVNSAFAKVDNLSGVKQIAAGRFHQLALKKDGTLWAWGANSVGELGNGTATGGTTGVSQVPGMNGVIGIAGGAYYSLAVKSDGSVWAWGYNNLGQLGDGTQTNRWAPIRVTGLSGIKEVSAGVTHSLAKGDDGSVWSWGSNTYGQLGDGSLTARLTPVLVQTNGAPQVVLTTPSGSQEVPTVVGITTLSIGWTQNDSEGTTFTGFQVQILDEAGEVVLDSGTVAQNTTSNTASWTVTEALPVGQKLQVRVKVSDEGAGSEWSAAGWMQVSGEGQAGSSIVAGGTHSVQLKSDGTVWAWGQNTQGQLGNGSLLKSSTAVQVTGLEDVVAVSAAGDTTLALKADGTVWSWGSNSNGQLGNGSTMFSAVPVQVTGLSGVIAIASSDKHSLALKSDGTVWGWGVNSNYQLGDGTNTQRLTPVKAIDLSGITAIAAGSGNSLALKNDGSVWASRMVQNNKYVFAQLTSLSRVKQIAVGTDHWMALGEDGAVWTWGTNTYGQLGNGTTVLTNQPAKITTISGVVQLKAGDQYSLAVKSDGSVWAWGSNKGRLGEGSNYGQILTPIRVTGLSGIKEVSAGVTHSLAKGDDGSVWSWGSNTYGQLGDGSLTARLTPVLVQTNGAPQVVLTTPSGSQEVPTVVGITTPSIGWTQNDSEGTTFTGFQVQILDEAGEVVLDSGTVAQNTTSNTASWTVTEALPVGQKLQVRVKVSDEGAGSEWSAAGWMQVSGEGQAGSSIVAGGTHSVQLKSDGTVWAWGQNTQGQLGNGSLLKSSTAVQVTGLEDVVAVSAAGDTTLALKADGTVWSWGSNSNGQLGNGSTMFSAVPVQVTGLSGVIAIASSDKHSLALKSDGTVWGWGVNSNYQLGDGTNTQRLTPVKAIDLSGITAIAAGSGNSLALKNDGSVWASRMVQNNKYVFAQLTSLSRVKQIAVGTDHWMALGEDGAVWTWGTNTYGQLGNGTTVLTNQPAKITTISGVVQLKAGDQYSLAVKSDGSVWAWGSNKGRLGEGSNYGQILTPIRVTGLSGIKEVSAGVTHSLAKGDDGSVWAWGSNTYGQLGDGSLTARLTPVLVQTNGAPQVVLTTPSGSQEVPTVVGITTPSIGWTQNDSEGTTFTGFQVQILDEAGEVVLDSGTVAQNTTSNTASWTVTEALPVGQKLQVRVKVSDEGAGSEWSAAGWMQVSGEGQAGSSIVAGGTHSVQLKSDGTVWAWGQNTQGQLGNGSLLKSSTAVQVTGLEDVVAVSAAGDTTLALKADGTVWSWGSNSNGQLGNGSTMFSAVPVQVTGLSGVIAIASSDKHSLALKSDGTVWGWGVNSNYQLGDGTNTQRLTPVKAIDLSGITAIAAGSGNSLALKNDGSVWASRMVQNNKYVFAQLTSLSRVKQIAVGTDHWMALGEDGAVWTWGTNTYGQLGNGTTVLTNQPAKITTISGVVQLKAGDQYSLAVKSDGSVWAWGSNKGRLGEGSNYGQILTPIRVTGLSGIKEVSAGVTHSLAKGDDGSVWAWGSNTYGQLGDGSLTARLTPVLVQTNGAPQVVLTTPSGSQEVPTVVGITTPSIGWTQNDSEGTTFTGFQVQILDEAGEVVLDSGTVAQNTTSNTASWTVTEALPVGQKLQVRVKVSDEGAGSEWSAAGWMQVSGEGQAGSSIVAGGTHSVQLKSDGTVWAWGQNTQGQLGNGSLLNSSTAVQVTGLEDVVAVSAAGETTLALKADGTVWSWGSNSRGQLGNGSTTSSAIPVQVKELSGVIAISNSESEYSLALKGDGTVWGWGSNSSYQLGDGTNTQRLTPVKAVGLSGITAIEANGTSMALKNDGTVWKVVNSAFAKVDNLSGVKQIAAGRFHQLALKKDGTLWAWGANSVGELGNGTATGGTTGVSQVPGMNGVIGIAGGAYYSLAVKSDGSVWAWGYNNLGQLGDGTQTNRWAPIRVTGLSGIKEVSAGVTHSLAKGDDGSVWSWGSNTYGQLGDGSLTARLTPVLVQTNGAPQVVLTTPSGSQEVPTVVGITTPSIGWTQNDSEGTTFTGFQVQILDEAGEVVLDSGTVAQNTTSNTTSWTVTDNLPNYKLLMVKVKVFDGVLWSEWSEICYLIIE